jgi:hypothetical protein
MGTLRPVPTLPGIQILDTTREQGPVHPPPHHEGDNQRYAEQVTDGESHCVSILPKKSVQTETIKPITTAATRHTRDFPSVTRGSKSLGHMTRTAKANTGGPTSVAIIRLRRLYFKGHGLGGLGPGAEKLDGTT